MAGRGALPVGLDLFGNMSTFAPTWSLGNEARILAYRHLPDAGTWASVRRFADGVLDRVRTGNGIAVPRDWNYRELIKGTPSIAGTKLLIGGHAVDAETCVACDACVQGCPVGAVDATTRVVDTSRCVACLGCVNTCPTGAMKMRFLGTAVQGFTEFLRRNAITIAEPPQVG
jgi:ferredoxin